MRAMNDFLFVRQIRDTVSPGGILLVLGDQKWNVELPASVGQIFAVGPGKRDVKGRFGSMWGLTPGQLIAYSPHGNAIQKVDGEELVVIRRDSVIGVVEDKEAA